MSDMENLAIRAYKLVEAIDFTLMAIEQDGSPDEDDLKTQLAFAMFKYFESAKDLPTPCFERKWPMAAAAVSQIRLSLALASTQGIHISPWQQLQVGIFMPNVTAGRFAEKMVDMSRHLSIPGCHDGPFWHPWWNLVCGLDAMLTTFLLENGKNVPMPWNGPRWCKFKGCKEINAHLVRQQLLDLKEQLCVISQTPYE